MFLIKEYYSKKGNVNISIWIRNIEEEKYDNPKI